MPDRPGVVHVRSGDCPLRYPPWARASDCGVLTPACVAQNGGLHVHLQRCVVGRHQSQPTHARYRAQVPDEVSVGHTKVCRGLGSQGAACDDVQASETTSTAAFLARRDARNLAAQCRLASLRRADHKSRVADWAPVEECAGKNGAVRFFRRDLRGRSTVRRDTSATPRGREGFYVADHRAVRVR